MNVMCNITMIQNLGMWQHLGWTYCVKRTLHRFLGKYDLHLCLSQLRIPWYLSDFPRLSDIYLEAKRKIPFQRKPLKYTFLLRWACFQSAFMLHSSFKVVMCPMLMTSQQMDRMAFLLSTPQESYFCSLWQVLDEHTLKHSQKNSMVTKEKIYINVWWKSSSIAGTSVTASATFVCTLVSVVYMLGRSELSNWLQYGWLSLISFYIIAVLNFDRFSYIVTTHFTLQNFLH